VKVSILHISDLHRDPDNPIRNDVLLTSLESDRKHYSMHESPAVRRPDIVVVSGDIVQGVKANAPEAELKLRVQYDEALDYLNQLTDRFVGGDHSRGIIVPGNHDVSDYQFRNSLRKLDLIADRKKELVEQLFTRNSRLRWSWQTFELFEIADEAAYQQRFAAFAHFYDRFYEGARTFQTDPQKQVEIFDFPTLNLAFAGFSSCHNNDLCNRQATIHPACIAQATGVLRQPRYARRIRIAVWHHNTEGPPAQSDYLDPGVLQNLIDSGFSLGFHGHQHRPQFLDARFKYGINRDIKVISAGTLCGSASFRHGRAYNVIELDTDALTGRLHVREMQNDDLAQPIWGRRPLQANTTSYFAFDFAPPEPAGPHSPQTSALLQAQDLYEAGHLSEAAEILTPMLAEDDLARPLLLECLVRLPDARAIATLFDPPQGDAEAIHLMNALWELAERQRLAKVLALPLVEKSADPSVVEMRRKYQTRLK
jgi:Calcineurin-like phosphoesterase